MVVNDRREMKADMTGPLLEDNAVLSQQTSNLVDRCGPRLNKTFANTVNGLNVGLLLSLIGNKTHSRTLNRLTNSLRIIGIIFVGHQVRLDEPRMYSLGGVSTRLNDSRPVCGTGTCFHADNAMWQVGEKRSNLSSFESPAQNSPSFRIHTVQLKSIFCQINTDYANVTHGMASFKG
jgi:hypothetical protein